MYRLDFITQTVDIYVAYNHVFGIVWAQISQVMKEISGLSTMIYIVI